MAFVVLGSGMLLGEVNSIRIGPNPLADYKAAQGALLSDGTHGLIEGSPQPGRRRAHTF
jgi:hypothetical protein